LRLFTRKATFASPIKTHLPVLASIDFPEKGGIDMVMGWIWVGIIGVSVLCALWNGQGAALSSAVIQGAQAGIELGVSIAGSLCLWSGVGRLMEAAGVSGFLSKLFSPLLTRLFPSSREDAALRDALSGNICANFLGLGNAATPLGVRAAKRLRRGDTATDELCRLVVLNTASIQLLPTNVAAVRASLGCATPFDILPAVWVTSLFSAGLGVTAAWLLGRSLKK